LLKLTPNIQRIGFKFMDEQLSVFDTTKIICLDQNQAIDIQSFIIFKKFKGFHFIFHHRFGIYLY
jgi:hypothetical protein